MTEETNISTNNTTDSDSDIDFFMTIVRMCESSTSSDSSSDDSCFDDEPRQHPTVENFAQKIDQFDENDFKSHMRLKRDTVNFLIDKYHTEICCTEPKGGKPKLSAKVCIYMYLWYISNTLTYRQLGILFGVAKSTAWYVIRCTVDWLIKISQEYIKWPTGATLENTCRKFQDKKGIPGVVGAIDCTHITINAPTIGKESYFDRKKNYSLVVQAIVDADKKFLDIHCGEPGSMHDSRVLRRSQFYRNVIANYTTMFPNGTFIIGDSAYKCTNWLVTPFKDNGLLTEQQKKFNYIHSSTRMVVENAFGLLKGRFRRLYKFTEHRDLASVTKLIGSACVLHNLCIIKEGPEDTFAEIVENIYVEEADEPVSSNQQTNKRDSLYNYLIQEKII